MGGGRGVGVGLAASLRPRGSKEEMTGNMLLSSELKIRVQEADG